MRAGRGGEGSQLLPGGASRSGAACREWGGVVGSWQAGRHKPDLMWYFAVLPGPHCPASTALAPTALPWSGLQVTCPVVFRGANGAAAGVAAQHSQCFAAWYASVPGLKVRP